MLSHLWDKFVGQASAYIDTGKVEDELLPYKVEVAETIASVRNSVLSNSGEWKDQIVSLNFRGLVHWVNQDKLRDWVNENPAHAKQALQKLWSGSGAIPQRIDEFCACMPDTITGTGTQANVASVLLMGLDADRYPPYNRGIFRDAYKCTGHEPQPSRGRSSVVYERALDFLDSFIDEAGKRGVPLKSRLYAQSLVWGIIESSDKLDDSSGAEREGGEEFDDGETSPNLSALARKLHFPDDSFLKEIKCLLAEKRQVIFQGPPGTGKTYVAKRLASHLAGLDERVTVVQFHPSYSYEDFVQGYRPALLENGQPGFKLRRGPLLRMAKLAGDDPNPRSRYFIVIDEINRGNLGKILGELYFLLEYRDEAIQLQYAEEDEPFKLPPNLYIIGTMNTADRSIALVDLALRRRFSFVDFTVAEEPIKGLLERWLDANGLSHMNWVADIVARANEKLDDRHAAIGPSYFMRKDSDGNPGLKGADVERIWRYSILPYLEERLYGERDGLGEFALDSLRKDVAAGPSGDRRNGENGDAAVPEDDR